MYILFLLMLVPTAVFARPAAYTELLDYVIQAPDQAETGACLFVGSTGAMEILANKKNGLKFQRPGDRFDLSERFLIHAPKRDVGHYIPAALSKFNGRAIHFNDLPFVASYDDPSIGREMWVYPDHFNDLPRMEVPRIKTQQLFVRGDSRWSTNVLTAADVEAVKQALWVNKSPVVINYNDTNFWHVIVVVGYDDNLNDAACYQITPEECAANQSGAFYVRDSFGVATESRDADWFRVKVNTAFVVKLAP